jgi:cytochrome c oxidase cbb3-type subunit 3
MSEPAASSTDYKPDQLKDGGHAFDGIQEYDNNLPKWWLWLFYATIVWAIWYVPFYHGGPGKVGPDALKHDLAELAAQRAKLSAGSALDEAGLRALAGDPARIAAGKQTYAQMCVACHGPEGLGGVGPNLRDRHWLVEPTMTGITTVLEKGGRPGKGMAPYANLGTEAVRNLAVYVVSLNREGLKANPAKPAASDEKEAPLDW